MEELQAEEAVVPIVKMLNIDFLKNNYVRPPWQHGLGFISLNMKDGSKLNFHSDLSNHESKSPHSHPGDFRSTCLFGKIKNITYAYKEVPKSDWYLATMAAKIGSKPKKICDNVEPIIISEEIQNKGDTMNHFHNKLHDVDILSTYACTKVITTTKYIQDVIVLSNKNIESIYAYAKMGTAQENWEIIDEILKHQEDVLL